jgi:CRISPR-associated endonuclease Cas1 subtype II
MTWRIVEIASNCKLELKLNYMVVRGEETRRVHVSEIAVLILENTMISMTASLICELTKRKVKIIFCDERRNPYGELTPYYGSHDSVDKLRKQIKWNPEKTCLQWTEIVRNKITKQMNLLLKRGHSESASMLAGYIGEMTVNDTTNREGHAAKVYFNALFGKDFSRDADNVINACLNYGYSILLSAFNREISSNGYSTQLGIFHDNMFNPFNLASDLMEPFRPLVDECVLDMGCDLLGPEEKRKLIDILNKKVSIGHNNNYLINAIKIYTKSFFDSIDADDISKMMFYEDEIHESNGFL